MAKILFVAGDVGGAMAQVPVAQLIHKNGHEINVLVDAGPRAKAINAWKKSGFPTNTIPYQDTFAVYNRVQQSADVVVSGSCATAYELECAVIEEANALKKPSAILADVIFSHNYPYFQKLHPTNWFALDQTHKESILALRPTLNPENVIVTGQPTYDNLKQIIKNKKEIRAGHRATLGIAPEIM